MPAIIRSHIVYPVKQKAEPVPTIVHAHRSCRRWTADEDNKIRRYYRSEGSKAVGAMIGRDYRTVQDRARRLGVTEGRT